MAEARHAGLVTLFALLGVALLLAALPRDLAALRVAGVSVLWWYAGVIAPLVATAVTIAVLVRRG